MPGPDLKAEIGRGLERLCEGAAANASSPRRPPAGVERIEARFFGDAYARHRHDTYAIGLTLSGVQRFWYRGAERVSRPGQIIVLHPDEVHDGGAGDESALQLPHALCRAGADRRARSTMRRAAVRRRTGDRRPAARRRAGRGARRARRAARRTRARRSRRPAGARAGAPRRPSGATARRPAARQAKIARDYLDAHAARRSLRSNWSARPASTAIALARHFRALYATSPHRYLLMRRLARARALIGAGAPLADIAAATGFADQAHFSRHFKKAYGLPPGRWAALDGGVARVAPAPTSPLRGARLPL